MKPIPNRTEKLIYLMTRQGLSTTRHAQCAIAKLYKIKADATTPHHRLHDTNSNVKRFPRFINSVFNLWLVNQDWHMEHPHAGKVPLLIADEIELMLTSNEKLNQWAQSPRQQIPLDILPFVKVIYDLLDGEGLEALYA